MAPPKKNDEDKAKRLNFTIPPALYSAFHQKCRDEGKEISKTLQNLIEMYLNDSVCIDTHQIHTISNTDTSSSVIQALEARIEKLEQEKERAIDIHQIHIESTPEPTPAPVSEPAPEPFTQKPAIVVSPVAPMEVSPEPLKQDSMPGNDNLMTTKEIVNLIAGHELSTDTKEYDKQSKRVRDWMKRNGIKSTKIGKNSYYPREEVEKYIAEKQE